MNMTIKVLTYGNVSPSFKKLSIEILENVSKDMRDFPPKCTLHLCKSTEDVLKLQKEQAKKLSYFLGRPVAEGYSVRGIGTFYWFESPKTIIVEDFIKPRIIYLEELEGSIAHEGGHDSDLFKNKKFGYSSGSTPLKDCIFSMKCEYEAENNAIEAGYYSGIIARRFGILTEWAKAKETVNFPMFYTQLNLMASQAAFVQSDKPSKCQKQLAERLWNNFSQSRKHKTTRELVQSKELKEHPELFGNESFLEDFVFKKHHGWNFSL